MKQLTDTGSLNLFPKWAPDGKEIIFTTFSLRQSGPLFNNTRYGEWRAVSYKQGLNTTGA